MTRLRENFAMERIRHSFHQHGKPVPIALGLVPATSSPPRPPVLLRRAGPSPRTLGLGWYEQVRARLVTQWLVKMLGTMFGIAAFFGVYFWLLRHPFFPVKVMPLTAIDRLVVFQPAALPLYLSLWVYVSLAPALLLDRREFAAYGGGAVALSLIGLGVFVFWPTAVPRPEVDWSLHPTFAFLKSADAAGNACPSLHAAFAVFTAIWFGRLLREMGVGRLVRACNWLWCLGILYSTVAIRQHVSLDALAGAALGAAVGLIDGRRLHVVRARAGRIAG